MTPEFAKAAQNMLPGVITAEGFLGDDERPLTDIIEADEESVAALGLDYDAMVRKMRELMTAGRKGLGEPVTIDGRWIVRVDEARGFLASPFEDGVFRKTNVEVELVDARPGSAGKILYTDLSLHLVEKYHFFEGKGSPFRIEPRDIKAVLDL